MQQAEVLAYRIHAQQLDRAPADRPTTDAAIFDLGIQDTGRDGASWALTNRGVPISGPAALEADPDVALSWTLRSAPHYYRRVDLLGAMTATSPFSDTDASKRIAGAGQPLKAADVPIREGLAEVARQLRAVVTEPLSKGEVSTRLSAHLTEPFLRSCVTCGVAHSWEVPFRIGALYAGLELEPGTSPPVLHPIPGWPDRPPGPAPDPLEAPAELQPIRNYLRFLGPATPKDVAAFLDAPVTEIKAHWPADVVEVDVDGQRAWLLESAAEPPEPDDLVRLLGGFDLFLQGRDRSVILPDDSRHKAMWPTLGRPGAVLAGGQLIGTWRPNAAAGRFTLRLDLWAPVTKAVRTQIGVEAERLAAHRGQSLVAIEEA